MGGHVTEQTLADMLRMHNHTFRLRAPYSCTQLLVLVVRGALVSAVKFTMIINPEPDALLGRREVR